ncbi:hypothetical protein C8R46DRAFT_1033959 [Mycena filopes]|nr:hypothetical protein C8R46DRAFT_1033959 [Mycena filopes]
MPTACSYTSLMTAARPAPLWPVHPTTRVAVLHALFRHECCAFVGTLAPTEVHKLLRHTPDPARTPAKKLLTDRCEINQRQTEDGTTFLLRPTIIHAGANPFASGPRAKCIVLALGCGELISELQPLICAIIPLHSPSNNFGTNHHRLRRTPLIFRTKTPRRPNTFIELTPLISDPVSSRAGPLTLPSCLSSGPGFSWFENRDHDRGYTPPSPPPYTLDF